jgi:uncharacterized membrane protein YhiD involved in acid resistance
LTDDEAEKRLAKYGSNLLKPKKRSDTLTLLLTQFKSPLVLILIFAGGVVAGIGFIGAGEIWADKDHIRGITTAASLWAVATIGLACGAVSI